MDSAVFQRKASSEREIDEGDSACEARLRSAPPRVGAFLLSRASLENLKRITTVQCCITI